MSGALNSVNSNTAASIAFESSNATTQQLQQTQSQVSIGYRVSSAVDDGDAFAVAQTIRADVSALTSVNQQLGSAPGLLNTTTSAPTSVSKLGAQLQSTLVKLFDATVTGNPRSQYVAQYKSLLQNVKAFIQDANYNGRTLIANFSGNRGTFSKINITHNEAGGTFTKQRNAISIALNTFGNATNFVSNQINFNLDKIASRNQKPGALVDANLAQESAQIQSLQIKRQLSTFASSSANQAPSILLKLFP